MTKRIGRPTKYKKRYCKDIIEYFDQPASIEKEIRFILKSGTEKITHEQQPNKLPTVIGFCNKLNITRQTILNWTDKYPEFLDAYTRAKQYAEDILTQNGLMGLYNPGFATLVGKNAYGWKDKQEIDANMKVDLEVNFIKTGDNDKDQSWFSRKATVFI